MSKEAMKLALEALEDRGELSASEFKEKKNDAITAIKEALAQPEQEPYFKFRECEDSQAGQPPPQRTWVGLSDRTRAELWQTSRAAIPRFYTYATLIEARLKERNT